MRNVKIAGVGISLPEKVVKNSDLAKIVDTSDEWIVSRTGIRERRIMQEGEMISDHAVCAAKEAITAAGMSVDDLDFIINATFTADFLCPSNACIIQEKLGVTKPIPVFDLAAACSGWVYGVEMANNLIRAGSYATILVIGGDAMSPFIDWTDRSTCVLFGDGVGAAVVTASDQPGGVLAADLGANGKHAGLITISGGGSRLPAYKLQEDPSLRAQYYFKMDGNAVFKIVTRIVVDSIKRVCDRAQVPVEKLDCIVPHQANYRMIDYIARSLKIPEEKIGLTVDKYANSSAGTIPITLYECLKAGKIKQGDHVVFTAFGAGLTYASLLIKWI
ncbi:MAG: hypothetical protein A2487_07045 [Candidatus Raymondbacteria bacterium RifOxyC12_full_50_8]|uniref:Beta-ketoacyl-[acyl-carrier-protein] synthase III n=1 Tax=Candidatus Raymondbacteria bacterium RIFOXYD12_FULL_49_13 TaxID=1817890 RepID=A0A1F7FC70_UNCRA|nr:MAG: hypothetical protein A2350_00010 [Candidatus Raymondbacteria bacterium RifOxyB12_full_50_8]OGJ89516.1 MAG: hypothetical protein A2248_03315 [Candidatus Raymondbacteria bacterium RIFOXYA2_FULL_49_16]OGJ96809.1 MAG: hypothetical protein A2487_07045 [Candidatus Raymondbacteria bacterium RifOxyC12_full_50_8]OGK04233.1 MAG: hypothetical protein A2519_17890 [Candidatus Raymondbacteria bacterium RIFOXYD12_FULL_49_13]OGP42484.1 MAG: hypothetical protein A2324_17350 [Candidatus Raymondbacteria b